MESTDGKRSRVKPVYKEVVSPREGDGRRSNSTLYEECGMKVPFGHKRNASTALRPVDDWEEYFNRNESGDSQRDYYVGVHGSRGVEDVWNGYG